MFVARVLWIKGVFNSAWYANQFNWAEFADSRLARNNGASAK